MRIRRRQATESVLCLLAMFLALGINDAAAAPQKTTIAVAPFESTVQDISAPAARNMFIKALSKTSRFAILTQAPNNNLAGVDYVVDGVIAEAKATPSNKTNAMTFLRAMAGDNLLSLEMRVYDARTMALVDTISTKSGEINKSSKFGADDATNMLGAIARGIPGAGGNTSEATSAVEQTEQRLEPLVTELANQFAARYGGGSVQSQPPPSSSFGMPGNQQRQPAQGFAPTQPSQRGQRR